MNTPVCPFTCRISVRFLAPWSTCSASHKDDCKIYKGPWSLILAGTLTRSWWTASILPSCGRELTTRAPSRVWKNPGEFLEGPFPSSISSRYLNNLKCLKSKISKFPITKPTKIIVQGVHRISKHARCKSILLPPKLLKYLKKPSPSRPFTYHCFHHLFQGFRSSLMRRAQWFSTRRISLVSTCTLLTSPSPRMRVFR